MAQLNSLIVTGNSRFLNPINGNARNGVYYVKGTQTASTGAWTGVIPIPALYDGLTIMYYLPYAGSGNATLNLTLSNGATTGAINCYYSTSRLTTHYGKGSNIVMTYHPAGSISVDGTATTDNRWIANANYTDGNTNTWRSIKVNDTQLIGSGTSTGAVNFKSGTNCTVSGSGNDITFTGPSVPTSASSHTTGISVADHTTGSITGVQSSTTTASKVTLGTAISVPNVTSAGSASNWVFENITVPKAASSATSIPNVTATGSGSFTATVTNGVLSFSHVHTAPTLGTAISVTGVSGSTTASHVKSGGNGTAPTLGTAISVPNVTGATDVTVPIKNTSSTTVVTSKTHTVTDNGHTHTLS